MEQVHVMEHPLITHKLSLMRDKYTVAKEFREAVAEISALLCYEATKDLPTQRVDIDTPIASAKFDVISGRKISLVSILRAGTCMAEGILELIPNAKVGHIGLYREPETMSPITYYCKLPSDISQSQVFLLDPLIATGGSMITAAQYLKNHGAQNITILTIITVPDAIEAIHDYHPDVPIYCAAIDEGLNEDGYIVPGIGDAGNRMFGTK